ncbi:MAG: HEPN domain-containing protein [Deltaproteobacteria bacterium]|nr:HEPN domain-containing protein [Deltaproteobacteria bacterium]
MIKCCGKFVLRIPPDMHRLLIARANTSGASLNRTCLALLSEALHGGTPTPSWKKPLPEIVARLKARFRGALLGVLVFGSRIRGEATEHSDIDLLVVLTERVPLARTLYRWWDEELQVEAEAEINPHFVHLPGDPEMAGGLWFEVALQNEIVYQQGRRLTRAIEGLLACIGKGTIRREWAGGQPYWTWREHENKELAKDYITRAGHRLAALETLMQQRSFADVVREAQENVELSLKALLLISNIEVPRLHDVSDVLKQEVRKLPSAVKPHLERLASISKGLRRDRELAYYGARDLTPSEFYEEGDAAKALTDARWVYTICHGAFT